MPNSDLSCIDAVSTAQTIDLHIYAAVNIGCPMDTSNIFPTAQICIHITCNLRFTFNPYNIAISIADDTQIQIIIDDSLITTNIYANCFICPFIIIQKNRQALTLKVDSCIQYTIHHAIFFFNKIDVNIFQIHLIRCLVFYACHKPFATGIDRNIICTEGTAAIRTIFIGYANDITIIISLNNNISCLKIYCIVSVSPMAPIDNTINLTAITC